MKFGFVDEHRGVWPVRMMCRVLGLSASGYYAWRVRPESLRAAANRALIEDIRLIHAESCGTYGSPRVHAVLRGHGRRVGRSRVERLMRRAGLRGLAALPRRTRTTDSRHSYPIAPNRLGRNFQAAAPGQVWLADLTYIPTGEGWLYLAGILDMHTRKLVGWSMRDTLHTQIALEALTMAIERQKPAPALIHHSDRGIQYAAETYRSALAQSGITQSQNRASPSPGLRHPRRGPTRSVRLYRGLLQFTSPALGSGIYQSRRDGTQSGLTPSTFSGEDQTRPMNTPEPRSVHRRAR